MVSKLTAVCSLMLGLSTLSAITAQERGFPVANSIGRFLGYGYTRGGYHAASNGQLEVIRNEHPAHRNRSGSLFYPHAPEHQLRQGNQTPDTPPQEVRRQPPPPQATMRVETQAGKNQPLAPPPPEWLRVYLGEEAQRGASGSEVPFTVGTNNASDGNAIAVPSRSDATQASRSENETSPSDRVNRNYFDVSPSRNNDSQGTEPTLNDSSLDENADDFLLLDADEISFDPQPAPENQQQLGNAAFGPATDRSHPAPGQSLKDSLTGRLAGGTSTAELPMRSILELGPRQGPQTNRDVAGASSSLSPQQSDLPRNVISFPSPSAATADRNHGSQASVQLGVPQPH